MTTRLRELLGKATKGPWRVYDKFCDTDKRRLLGVGISYGSDICKVHAEDEISNRSAETCHANAALIVEAVNTLPALLDALEEARGALEKYVDFFGVDPAGLEAFEALATIEKFNQTKGN